MISYLRTYTLTCVHTHIYMYAKFLLHMRMLTITYDYVQLFYIQMMNVCDLILENRPYSPI